MKYFPIKVAVICLLVTPFLYIGTLTYCERYLNTRYTHQIQNILIGDSKKLLEGDITLEEQIANNISNFIKNDRLAKLFTLDLDIIVTSGTGKIVYPIFLDTDSLSQGVAKQFDPQQIAKNNYTLLKNGLSVRAQTNLSHGSSISIDLITLFSVISFSIFFVFFKIGSLKASRERQEKAKIITELKNKEESQQQVLERLENDRNNLFNDIESLNKKYQENKTQAKINEEELFEEIISLEEKLNSFIDLKQSKDLEIKDLKSKIKKYERRKGSKTKRIDYDFMKKRFFALYKNIIVDRKALSGFLNLNDDQQIKAEEIVFLLDRSPDKVTVKRKVFSGKKHKNTSFEVLFAYNGRLYFQKKGNNMTRVLLIGTKNTQTKDMEYLHNL